MHRRHLVALALVLALLLPACGDDNGTDTGAADGASGNGATTTSEPSPSGRGGDTEDVTDQGSTPEVSFGVVDNEFKPSLVNAAGDAQLTVHLENTGSAEHTFTIDDADIDELLDPGASVETTVDVPASGTVAFYCRFHGNSGMRGTITVAGSSTDGPTTTTPTEESSDGYGY